MSIIYDDDYTQVVETITPNGSTIQTINKPGSPGANREAITAKAEQALTANATYLAIPAPTAAEVRSQTELLTREVNGLIRLLLNQLDDISDT